MTAYPRQPLARVTKGTGSGLFATPRAHESGDWQQGNNKHRALTLTGQVKRWPTPSAADALGGPGNSGRAGGLNLRTAVDRYPTPSARDWKSGKASEQTRARNSRPLNEVVTYMTPTANMGEKSGGRHRGKADTLPSQVADLEGLATGSTGQLNPTWVEWLMGWPIGWTDLKPLATGRFQQWLQLHGIY